MNKNMIFDLFYFISAMLSTVGANYNNYNYGSVTDIYNYNPVCVVGGGISGLTVATILQSKGHNVLVFEKSSQPGGKVETLRISDDILVEMCPLFHLAWYHSFIRLLNQFYLTSAPFNDTDKIFYDVSDQEVDFFPPPQMTDSETALMTDAIIRYGIYRGQNEKGLEFGYVNASPELFQPIQNWLLNKNLEILIPIMRLVLTKFGYGAPEETPTLYVLKYIDAELIYSFVSSKSGTFRIVKEGLDVLIRRMTANLNVYLNSEVTNVVAYSQNRQQIFFKDEQSVSCKSVILAFPPLFSNIKNILRDLTPEELELFQQVRIQKYTSAANVIPLLEHHAYVDVRPLGDGDVTGFLLQSSKKMKHVYSSYSWIRGSYNETVTPGDLAMINEKLKRLLNKIDKSSYTFHSKISEYFPHVETESLIKGFYKKFDALQGKRGVYFLATLLSFETMPHAVKAAEDFVDKYFY